MRWIFALLILSNLAVAGWWYWRYTSESPVVPPARVAVQDKGELRLLQELPEKELIALPPPRVTAPEAPPPEVEPAVSSDEAKTSAPQAEPLQATAPPTEAVVVASCYRVDMLLRKDLRDALAKKLSATDITVLERGEQFNERTAYWVFIPPLKTSAEAQQIISALSKARVRDFLLVRSGDSQNAISLGLFSQRDGAEKRLREISALHLKGGRPEMRARTSTYRSYYLLVKSEGDAAESRLLKQLQSEKRTADAVECPP